MSQPLFTIRYRGACPKNIQRAAFNKLLKEAYRLLGIHWHTKLRRKHFTHAGAREYQYLPRKGEPGSGRAFKGSYTARKLKTQHHTLPLVFTGESRQLTQRQDVRSTSKGSRVVIRANKFNFRHKASKIRMREEMTRLSDKDKALLTVLLGDFVRAQLAQANWRWAPTTVSIP